MGEHLIERTFFLEVLSKHISHSHLLILGNRKIGKTTVARQFLKKQDSYATIFVDLNHISITPEHFAVEFIGTCLFHYLNKSPLESKEFLVLSRIKEEAIQISKELGSSVNTIENELEKIRPNQQLLIETAFSFLNQLSQAANKKVLVVLDDVEHLLLLNNYPQIRDVRRFLKVDDKKVRLIATSAAKTDAKKFLNRFEPLELHSFEESETERLLNQLTKRGKQLAKEVHVLSNGNPFIISQLARHFSPTKSIKQVFVAQLLDKDSALYHHCAQSMEYYTSRARGQTLSKAVLTLVAQEELRLSDLARKVYRSAPVTKSLLERLIAVDVITKEGNHFVFQDEILGLWLKLVSQRLDVLSEKDIAEVAKEV